MFKEPKNGVAFLITLSKINGKYRSSYFLYLRFAINFQPRFDFSAYLTKKKSTTANKAPINRVHQVRSSARSKELAIRGLRLSCAILKLKPCKQTFFFYFISTVFYVACCNFAYYHDSSFASFSLAIESRTLQIVKRYSIIQLIRLVEEIFTSRLLDLKILAS